MIPSLILLVLVSPHLVLCLPLDYLYPFGENDGDSALPKSDEIASEPIPLKVPLKFFLESYDTIFVNNNGLVSLLGPQEEYVTVQFPVEYLVIAPLYANVDTRRGGTVWYRESFDPELLDRSADRINRLYPSDKPFIPKALFIATWDRVAHINASGEVNTFQLTLSNDGEESFLELMYPDGGIQWVQTRGQGHTLADAKAQAGIVSHDARLITLPNSGTDQIRHLDKLTNCDEPGLFVFRVGKIDESETVEPPPAYIHAYEQEPTSCAQGFSRCHSKAECVDTNHGFCCKCKEGFYGNGINCLVQDTAVRVSGKILMAGENEMYLQAYLVPGEGASYTAVTRVPPRLGPSLQLLEPLAATLGWLIAKPIHGGVNGFDLTGGVFNSTIEVRWPSGEKMNVKARYLGVDLVDQLRMEADVTGTLPAVPPQRTLSVPDYHQELTRTKYGVLRSQTEVKILVDDTERDSDKGVFVLTKTETIEFKEYCTPITSLRLKSSRHQLAYRAEEEVTRFASLNKISSNIEGEDPCIEGQVTCVANSSCVVDGDSFKCVCNPGFEVMTHANGADGCQDINECEEGSANCHQQAICLNEVGTFHCQCRPGYTGNGFTCSSENECEDGECHQPSNGYCSDVNNVETCGCNSGYAGYSDGSRFECWDVNECVEANACGGGDKSECLNTEGSYNCVCKEGYQLNNDNICVSSQSGEEDPCDEDPEQCQPDHGYCDNLKDFNSCRCISGWRGAVVEGKFTCVDHNECSEAPCDRNAQCFNNWGSFECKCRQGYRGDGFNCNPLQALGDCSEMDCGPRSHCEEEFGAPLCVCDSQYSGQHPNCIDIDMSDCFEDSDCGKNGRCAQNNDYYRCVCNEGYTKKGFRCEPEDIPVRTCMDNDCWCPDGYEDDGIRCVKSSSVIKEDQCKGQCSHNARCVYVSQSKDYQCQCKPGFEGDGVECTFMEISCSIAEICDINAMCRFDEYSNNDVCICNEGFEGDGTTYCYPSDECNSAQDCKMNAECLYNKERQANECVCAAGYDRDHEGSCLPLHIPEEESEETCSEECSEHATCESGRCNCQVGYRGDGLTCSPDCSQLGDCSPLADCIYNTYNYTYSCVCKKGYEGDGYVCNHIRNCLNTPTMCSVYATCLRTAQHTYVCTCNQGYYGNGTICREGTRLDSGGFLLVNQGRSTQRIPLEQSPNMEGKPILLHQDQVPIGIATDCVEGRVYWSDIAMKSIQSSKYDGSNIVPIITSGIESSEGVTVDWLHRAIYWTDSGLDTISKADLDTKETQVIIKDGLVNPRGIAVHPTRRKIYWSDWDRENPKLEMANLDGNERSILLKGQHVKLPNSLAIDWSRDELCWADAGTGHIECLGLSSRRHRTAVKGCKYPFGLAITSEKYYWTDWVTHKLESATKDGKIGTPFQMLFGGDDKLYGLTVVPETCPN